MRFCSLGSGSRGNAYVVECGDTTILIDCGFSFRALKERLAEQHLSLSEIDAVIVSHEHQDHVSALSMLMRSCDIPCYMSAGTAQALGFPSHWHCLSNGTNVSVGELSIVPIAVPHDVIEPVQFVIEDGGSRLAIFTDLGHVSRAVMRACSDVDALIVECNHDEYLLHQGKRPESVKQRIIGDYGHLSNTAAAHLIANTRNNRRQYVIAAHTSQDHNTHQLIQSAVVAADPAVQLLIATQHDGTPWLSI